MSAKKYLMVQRKRPNDLGRRCTCNAVKVTLGPKGRNVILDKTFGLKF